MGFGKAETSKGRPVLTMAYLKKSVVEVKAKENCLAHSVVIAMAQVTNNQDYLAYRKGRKSCPRSVI
jgi:hypothetical protein